MLDKKERVSCDGPLGACLSRTFFNTTNCLGFESNIYSTYYALIFPNIGSSDVLLTQYP
jgi:hypothetical protein